MQIGYLIAGLLFFCNPNFEIIDLLPDCIGCALLLYGIRKLAALTERGKAAARDLRTLLGISLAKALCCLLFLLLNEDGMIWMLTLTACFGVAEAFFFIRGMLHLDAAISYSAMQGSCEAVYAGKQLSAFTGYAVFFAIAKTVFSVLPTLIFLATDYGEVHLIETNWKLLFTLLQAVNLLLVTLFGGILFWQGLRFFRRLRRESGEYLSYLDRCYQSEVVDKPGVLLYKRLRLGGKLLFFGMLFLLPVRLDGLDFLPDLIAAGFVIACALLLRRDYPRKTTPVLLAGGLFALFSAAEWGSDLLLLLRSGYSILGEQRLSYQVFLDQYLYHDAGAYGIFLLNCGLCALKALCACGSFLLLYRIFREIIADHTGSDEGIRAETVAANTASVRKRLGRFLTAVCVLTVCSAVAAVFSRLCFLQPGPFWLVEFLFAGVLAVTVRVFCDALQSAVDNKYYFSELV